MKSKFLLAQLAVVLDASLATVALLGITQANSSLAPAATAAVMTIAISVSLSIGRRLGENAERHKYNKGS